MVSRKAWSACRTHASSRTLLVRVLILTLGTRGDVQSFLPLARELQHRGHEAAPHRFAELAAAQAVPLSGIDDGPLRVLDAGSAVGDVDEGGIRAKVALIRRFPSCHRVRHGFICGVVPPSCRAGRGAGESGRRGEKTRYGFC